MKTKQVILHAGAALLMIVAIGLPVLAQGRGEEPEVMQKDRDFDTRSRELRRISEREPMPAPLPKAAELLYQARSDFRSLQMVSKNLKQAASSTTPLDLKFVSNSATEVRVHAESLNTILPLPKRDKKAERLKPIVSMSPDELRLSVLQLTKLIQVFIANPSFREASLQDNEQTRKARLDLENVIELSKQLQRDSQKLEQATHDKKP